jgi:hypothetical protein
MKLVTIIAERPADDYGPFQTDNGFVADVIAKLSDVTIYRAASVVDIARVLKAICDDDDEMLSVQLIGHGSSGQLRLGACFMADETKARRWPYFVLDTTPSAIGFLAKFADRIGELALVGCNVGAEHSDWPVNGRALLYCLAEALHCTTSGADAITSPNCFDSTGRYIGPASIWEWSDIGPPAFKTRR